MGTSQADKAASHERIVDAAATQIRRGGMHSLNVASLMGEVGLTHGGFYRHFASRDALLLEAMETALDRSKDGYEHLPPEQAQRRALSDLIDQYLSVQHRDDPGAGCAMAALANDVALGDDDARTAYSHHVRDYLARIAETMPEMPGGPDETDDMPHVTLAAMVGALILARAVNDQALSDDILRRTSRGLRKLTSR